MRLNYFNLLATPCIGALGSLMFPHAIFLFAFVNGFCGGTLYPIVEFEGH
jgi:hypothetical protein